VFGSLTPGHLTIQTRQAFNAKSAGTSLLFICNLHRLGLFLFFYLFLQEEIRSIGQSTKRGKEENPGFVRITENVSSGVQTD
jgi:hypothetical protein